MVDLRNLVVELRCQPISRKKDALIRKKRGCKETHVSLHPLKTSQGIGKNGWNGQTSTRARQSRLKRKILSLALTGVLLGVLVYVEGGFCLFSKFASEFGVDGKMQQQFSHMRLVAQFFNIHQKLPCEFHTQKSAFNIFVTSSLFFT